MKKRLWVFILMFVLFLVIYTSTDLASANKVDTQPGTINDPVITKSYFDLQIDSKIAEALGKQVKSESPAATQPVATNTSNLTIVQLAQTQTLVAGSGTEIIVRTGKTVVTSSDESGIANVTTGKDITAGQAVENNHLLIVPREGRGIKPDPKNKQDIYVMVRGSYTVYNADGSKASTP
ncbi:hypothetical protein [Paenibacillus sp. YYML68]|uniref:hypothetical protein n=1 Tax=Paenibacillus sp. YYML68 TaxID=2909250 RepID=UPI00249239D1|nr:hypothetical protein [Paenibacillus sp. YYML68]